MDRPGPVSVTLSPVPVAVTGRKFMDGEPMKPATNLLRGSSYSDWGVPTCCRRASLMTAMR